MAEGLDQMVPERERWEAIAGEGRTGRSQVRAGLGDLAGQNERVGQHRLGQGSGMWPP
jgi:hypothetical protein